ncbi:MAG: SPFH domain-containing protein [Myxococcota bacterium]
MTDAARSIYRIRDVDKALFTESTAIVRSAAGRLELDELQSSRESMNEEIGRNLQEKALEWGLEITSTAITDVIVDERTKDAQRQQLNAERERRAARRLSRPGAPGRGWRRVGRFRPRCNRVRRGSRHCAGPAAAAGVGPRPVRF